MTIIMFLGYMTQIGATGMIILLIIIQQKYGGMSVRDAVIGLLQINLAHI